MAFGGLFGGGSGSDSSKSNNTSTDLPPNTELPSAPSPFGDTSSTLSPSPANSSSSQIRSRLQNAVVMQTNIMNAKYLISKVNENCFDKCIVAPGSSLSSKEQTCLNSCMEKYIEAWNVVSRTYVGRLQKEGAQLGGMVGQAGGRELA